MRIALIQMNSKEHNRDYNVDKACNRIKEAIQYEPNIISIA
jgi:predicted amidohydrolase